MFSYMNRIFNLFLLIILGSVSFVAFAAVPPPIPLSTTADSTFVLPPKITTTLFNVTVPLVPHYNDGAAHTSACNSGWTGLWEWMNNNAFNYTLAGNWYYMPQNASIIIPATGTYNISATFYVCDDVNDNVSYEVDIYKNLTLYTSTNVNNLYFATGGLIASTTVKTTNQGWIQNGSISAPGVQLNKNDIVSLAIGNVNGKHGVFDGGTFTVTLVK
ncbi:MAG: hypothetical protein ACYCQI_01010 [Gammaproteobacteria bacterium]